MQTLRQNRLGARFACGLLAVWWRADMDEVPIIDLTRSDAECVGAIAQACTNIGFYTIIGHAIPGHEIEAVHGAARAFFDLPIAEKRSVARPRPEQNRGFIGKGDETLARLAGQATAPDDKEVFSIGPLDVGTGAYFSSAAAYPHFAPNLWPERPAELRPAMETYWTRATALAKRLMSLSARALDLPSDFFEPATTQHISMLRLIDYPAQRAALEPGQLRAGEHTDLNMLTLVAATTDEGGIEVRRRDGTWVKVPYRPDAIAVNIGDALMRWTNDRWVSTPHRVANAPGGVRRQATAFFFQANYDCELACLPSCVSADNPARYAPTTIGEYRAQRFAKTAG
jgi:isopenicillin N synthase-like dioxygenase